MYLYFLFYTTMSECMIFYGPTVPEINYSSSSSITYEDMDIFVCVYKC